MWDLVRGSRHTQGMSTWGDFDPNYRWDLDCGDLDPDAHSETLRRYHQRLWSERPLPGRPGEALQLQWHSEGLMDSALGNFFGRDEGLLLSSDSAVPTRWKWSDTRQLRESDPTLQSRIDAAYWPLYAMGGMILFPRRMIGGQSINQTKGTTPEIADRFDLTVECIRRYYESRMAGTDPRESSPLGDALHRYSEFFDLFSDFAGYVTFWLLEDLLTSEGRVRFLMEGDIDEYDFQRRSPLPQTVNDYFTYLDNAEAVVAARSSRMADEWSRLRPA